MFVREIHLKNCAFFKMSQTQFSNSNLCLSTFLLPNFSNSQFLHETHSHTHHGTSKDGHSNHLSIVTNHFLEMHLFIEECLDEIKSWRRTASNGNHESMIPCMKRPSFSKRTIRKDTHGCNSKTHLYGQLSMCEGNIEGILQERPFEFQNEPNAPPHR